MTPLSWEHWIDRYSARGYQVLAPAWPGMDGDIEQLRADPSAIEHLGIEEIVDHYDEIIRGLDAQPIIMGHSFGGAFTEVLLDRGLGAAGVGIDAAAVKGIAKLPFSQLKSGFPVLKNPANRHRAVALTPEEFHYAFTNTMTEQESQPVYDRYAVPGPGRVLFQGAFANFNPHAPTRVDFAKDYRAPLLLIAGEVDHTVPPWSTAQRRALSQVGGAHRVQGVPGPLALHHRPEGLGGGRRLRPGPGLQARRARHERVNSPANRSRRRGRSMTVPISQPPISTDGGIAVVAPEASVQRRPETPEMSR
jgi:pimeloyl-ACP methyl ester carboxylesterase